MTADRRRLLVAFAVAIAIHETLAGIVPRHVVSATPQAETITHVQIARVAVRPTPTPQPRPTPSPHAARRTHVFVRAETATVVRTAGKAARREAIRHNGAPRPKPPVIVAQTRPVWDTPPPAGGQGGGAGTGRAAGSPGSGTTTGTGSGTSGNGSRGDAGDEPCGFVDFSDPHGSQYDRRTHGFWVDIRMSVHFADGSAQSVILDYPWYYPSEAANPWSDQNLHNLDMRIAFQSPPPAKLASEPAIVQYVVKHSTAGGLTLLRDCPTPAPSPSA